MPHGRNRKTSLSFDIAIPATPMPASTMTAMRLNSVNIQYSLRRERPSNWAYFLQTIEYHSIAPSLSRCVLNTMVQACRWQHRSRHTAIELPSLFGVEPLYKHKPDKVSNYS